MISLFGGSRGLPAVWWQEHARCTWVGILHIRGIQLNGRVRVCTCVSAVFIGRTSREKQKGKKRTLAAACLAGGPRLGEAWRGCGGREKSRACVMGAVILSFEERSFAGDVYAAWLCRADRSGNGIRHAPGPRSTTLASSHSFSLAFLGR